jgi:hypothetical protein
MKDFDFNAPAEVFALPQGSRQRRPMIYRRFETGAEAIRHVMEAQGSGALGTTIIETDNVRLDANDIRALYECSAYPLPRR